ncbi:hypothetical protein OIU85_004625 [Salix viminalis]|uniref:Uncharacterized protein n=1 Tax=Salix viminalis TaxID=40686 RepID=A0A9Q0SXZ6_SALVM|nr:hypothetical protein OIU85_004625 [Salix viminalis]
MGRCTLLSVWEQVRTTKPQEGGEQVYLAHPSSLFCLVTRFEGTNEDNGQTPQPAPAPSSLFTAQVSWPSVPWRQAWEWAVALYGAGHHVKNHILGMVLAATVYHIRGECDRRLHNQHYSSIQKTKDDVIHMVRGILANIGERDKQFERR